MSDTGCLLHRRKTCPCCRAVIRHRPVPVFLVKSIIALLAKANDSVASQRRASPLPGLDVDVWAGLFHDFTDESSDYDDDEDERLDDEDDGHLDDVEGDDGDDDDDDDDNDDDDDDNDDDDD